MADIDDVSEEVASALGIPVVVFDEEMALVSYSTQRSEVDHAQMAIILSRRATPGAAGELRRLKVASASGPVKVPPPGGGIPGHIAAPLRHGRQFVGYLTMEDPDPDGPISSAHAEILRSASERLGAMLHLRRLARDKQLERRRVLLDELLYGPTDGHQRAGRRLEEEGVIGRGDGVTVVVLRGGGAEPALTERMLLQVGSRLSPAKTAVLTRADESIALVPTGRALDARDLAAIRGELPRSGATLGVGRPRPHLEGASESLREARMAARAAASDPETYDRVASWDEMGSDRLLIRLPLDRIRLTDLPPAIPVIFDTPSSNGLLQTLETYLELGGNAKETAKRLVVHRSTLYYRLERIQALTGADLSDIATQRELHLALRVARLAGLYPRAAS